MPELPEVETIKLGLQNKIIGKQITDIEILVPKIFIGDQKEIIGKTVIGIWRRAKILGIDLSSNTRGPVSSQPRSSSPALVLLFHLKLTGQLVFVKDDKNQTFGHPIPFAGTMLPAKSTAVIFSFNDGSKLFYNDIRKFGWIKIINHKSLIVNRLFEKLGPEPLEKEFTNEIFAEILKKYKKPIKIVLMDQEAIAGVGNIYAAEALFIAKIDPRRPANGLEDTEADKLYKSLLKVLKMGIKYQGSSENAYVNVDGEKGSMQEHVNVYGKTGEYCPNKCGGKIKRIVIGGRGTYLCPSCQH